MPDTKNDNNKAADSKSTKIIAPGSAVLCGTQAAKVISVTLREGLFVYQVTWWNGNERKNESVSACELKATTETKFLTISEAQ